MIKKTAATIKSTASLFIGIVRAFNPLSYSGITQKALWATITFFLYFLVLLTLATAAFTMPSLAQENKAAGKLSKLAVSAEVATTAPIEAELFWLGNSRIFVNTTASPETAASHDISITSSEVRMRPLLCLLRNEVCDLLDVRQKTTLAKNLDIAGSLGSTNALVLLLVLLPGLFILLYISLLVKYAAIAAIAAALAYPVLKLTKRDTGFRDALKITAYAAVALAVLDFAGFILSHTAFGLPAFVPLAGYGIIVVAAIFFNEQQLAEQPN